MNEKEKLIKRLSSVQFSLWELHLYLDTHPMDTSALMCHKKYTIMAKELTDQYEKTYGPLTPMTGQGENWTKQPWPWELEESVR